MSQVFFEFVLHAARNVVLPVLGVQCIITTSLLVVPEDGSEGMGVAALKRSVYCVVLFHCLRSDPQVARAASAGGLGGHLRL